MLSFPSAVKHDLIQNIHHCTEWHRNQLLGSFYSTITRLCQELSPCNNLEFSLGFILTNSSWGIWFTASAEVASEGEISVRAVLWWVWHADFPAHLPAWRTNSSLVCSAKSGLLQSLQCSRRCLQVQRSHCYCGSFQNVLSVPSWILTLAF